MVSRKLVTGHVYVVNFWCHDNFYSDDKVVRTLAKIEVIGLADLPLPPEKAQMDLEPKRVLPKAAPHHPWGLFIKKAPPEPRNKKPGR